MRCNKLLYNFDFIFFFLPNHLRFIKRVFFFLCLSLSWCKHANVSIFIIYAQHMANGNAFGLEFAAGSGNILICLVK